MLAQHLKQGAKIVGLSKLIGSGRPAFAGCYRVVRIGPATALEFFERSTRNDASQMQSVMILPYRTGMINETPVGGGEVISGEFTGCVMSLYRKDGMLRAGHVDTNLDTTQRAEYRQMLESSKVELVAEYDTTGKIKAELGCDHSTVILCVADSNSIDSYYVSKGTHASSQFSSGPGDPEKKWRQIGETIYTVMKPCN